MIGSAPGDKREDVPVNKIIIKTEVGITCVMSFKVVDFRLEYDSSYKNKGYDIRHTVLDM